MTVQGWQGLPITSHADRILHRVAHLLRSSSYGLSQWCGGRIYVMADTQCPAPDAEVPMILVSTELANWQLALGGRAERQAGIQVGLVWEEYNQHRPLEPGEDTSVAIYDALCRTLTEDGSRALYTGDERLRNHVVETITTVFFDSLEREVDRKDGQDMVLLHRLLVVEVTIGYHVDVTTGHPEGLDDED